MNRRRLSPRWDRILILLACLTLWGTLAIGIGAR